MSELAPVVLFCYNRPHHTEQTLKALSECELSADSMLYVYCDGPKENATQDDLSNIAETRAVVKRRKWCKEVIIVESEKNKGLAGSVIEGTTAVVNRHGSVITLEDDVIVSRYFLRYMNAALIRYADHKNVAMIGGYNFPVTERAGSNSSYFLPLTSTQAWGTWQRSWSSFDAKADGYKELKSNRELREKFNLGGAYDFAGMLIQQMESSNISSWAIRWWWTVFKSGALVLYPDKSLIRNIGWDGSGRHSGSENVFFDAGWQEDYRIDQFPDQVKADLKMFGVVKEYLRKTLSGKPKSKWRTFVDSVKSKFFVF